MSTPHYDKAAEARAEAAERARKGRQDAAMVAEWERGRTPVALTLAAIRKLGPCEESYRRVSAILPKRGKITARQAVEAGCNLDDLAWVASAVAQTNKHVERILRHWLADCAARVLLIYERDHPADERVRGAIIAARQFADGQIGAAARAAASAAAWAAEWTASRGASRAAEKDWQLERLVYWLTDEAPKPLALPEKGGAA